MKPQAIWPPVLAGLLFGAGLVFSGLADPVKVLAFLTLGTAWDPTLLVVMAVAVSVAFTGFRLANRHGKALSGGALPGPPHGNIDRRLLAGAAIFGMGWGLSGYCPGPALVSAGFGYWPALVVVPGMLAGAWLADRVPRRG